MRKFEILFDHAEASSVEDAAFGPYGNLGFPAPPAARPWIYSNFVQSLDGIASFKGRHASGSDISQSPEDRWLMDLLRAHADGVILGINTLMEETRQAGDRGPVYKIDDPILLGLRRKLGRKREKNIFVTGAMAFDPRDFRVFDGDSADSFIITTDAGAARLKQTGSAARIIVAGKENLVDLPRAVNILRRELEIQYLLCEGGPTLYGYMSGAGLIDEKFLTISPVEVGLLVPPEQEPSEAEKSNPPRIRPTTFLAPGFLKETAPWWQWMSCRRIADHQFNRYRRQR